MPLESWIQHSRVNEFLYDWQTVIAGVLALVAAFGTIWMTRRIANRQIKASCEEADKVIAATRDQTEATVRLERERVLSEDRAFRAMLEAAMTGVLAEATWARKTYPQFFPEKEAGRSSPEALAVRQCITKGAFAELRAACIRLGSPLTAEFLGLEREIDNFALQTEDHINNGSVIIRWGKHAGLVEQLTAIEDKAFTLRELAARPGFSVKRPGEAEHAASSA